MVDISRCRKDWPGPRRGPASRDRCIDRWPGAPGGTPACLEGRLVTVGRRRYEMNGARSQRTLPCSSCLAARSPPESQSSTAASRSCAGNVPTRRGGERCRAHSPVPGPRGRWPGQLRTSSRHRSCPGAGRGSTEQRRGGQAGGKAGHSAAMMAANSAATNSGSEQTNSVNSSTPGGSSGLPECRIVVMATSETSPRRRWPAGRIQHWRSRSCAAWPVRPPGSAA